MAEKSRENKKLLIMENANKLAMTEVAKVLTIIDFRRRHSLSFLPAIETRLKTR